MTPKKLCTALVFTIFILVLSSHAIAQDVEGLCTATGGTWEEMSCGHYVCGMPPACAAVVPGCDCGSDGVFVDGVGCQASDACQISSLTTLSCGRIEIHQPILFETGGEALTEESLPVLAEIAETITEEPWIIQVEVQVHTDSSGSSGFNQQTSSRRAHVVVTHLLSLGVATERLVPRGMGESFPIASNDTAEGRASNRRVEFHIVDADECPLEY